MKRKSSSPARGSRGITIAVFFTILLLLLVGGAFLIKCLLIFSRSKFDGAHQFVLQVNEPVGNKTAFYIFSPDNRSITELTVNNLKSGTTAATLLQVPSDGQIVADDEIGPKDIASKLFWHFSSLHPTLTLFDAANLFFYAFTVPSSNISQKEISYPLPDPASQKVVSQVFNDQTLYREGSSITVVNATGVSGLGTQVAELLTHMGGNVVAVSTAEQEQATSQISYTGPQTYTVKRLAKVFGFPTEKATTPGMSDIVITIGKKDAPTFNL